MLSVNHQVRLEIPGGLGSCLQVATRPADPRDQRPPAFRIKDDCPGLTVLVSYPARGPAAARDGPRYTNMYETKNETTNPARTLVLATLGRPLGQPTR